MRMGEFRHFPSQSLAASHIEISIVHRQEKFNFQNEICFLCTLTLQNQLQGMQKHF